MVVEVWDVDGLTRGVLMSALNVAGSLGAATGETVHGKTDEDGRLVYVRVETGDGTSLSGEVSPEMSKDDQSGPVLVHTQLGHAGAFETCQSEACLVARGTRDVVYGREDKTHPAGGRADA